MPRVEHPTGWEIGMVLDANGTNYALTAPVYTFLDLDLQLRIARACRDGLRAAGFDARLKVERTSVDLVLD